MIQTQIILECEIHVVSVFRLSIPFKIGFGRHIDIGNEISILTPWNQFFRFSCVWWAVTIQNAERFILNVNAWIPSGWKRSRFSIVICNSLNKTTPESRSQYSYCMCVSTTMILTQRLKISESVIRKWKIGTYRLIVSCFIPWLMGC